MPDNPNRFVTFCSNCDTRHDTRTPCHDTITGQPIDSGMTEQLDERDHLNNPTYGKQTSP